MLSTEQNRGDRTARGVRGHSEQGVEQRVERGLALEARAGCVAEPDPAVLHRGVVGDTAEGLKDTRIRLATAE